MEMGAFLLWLSLFLVVLWTARLARAKGRNPWLWAAAAFFLMFVPWKILTMAPIVILLFLRSPQAQTGPSTDRVSCPRCRGLQSRSLRFCTNCGWEVGTPYSEDPIVTEEKELSTRIADDLGTTPPSPSVETVEPARPVFLTSDTVPIEDTSMNVESPPQEAHEVERPPASEIRPQTIPTPAAMTERGLGLFNQGRVQEAIDQFTKAIALDPGYIQAWAHRAEAYARIGRGADAAEDRRKLEALDASSAGG